MFDRKRNTEARMDFELLTNAEKKKLSDAYEIVFRSPQGKVVLRDLMKRCRFWRTSYEPNSDQTAFNEGKRTIFLRIINMANVEVAKLKEVVNE